MNRPFIFVSCGQYTEAEKLLGKKIADLVRSITGHEPFFAEEVHDLNGLDANILEALRDCVAFITVLHPRGQINRPDGSILTRASVWIEQEIAIASYIHRVEQRELQIIAFQHRTVDREGLRQLLNLNPIEFENEADVLAALPKLLEPWKSLKPSGIRLELVSVVKGQQEGHPIRTLEVVLDNDTNERITEYTCLLRVPSSILKHWSASYSFEVPSQDPNQRHFRFNESYGPFSPHERRKLFTTDYCTACAVSDCGEIGALVSEARVDATMWIKGREYTAGNTIKGLAMDRIG
jgi:hypothetical protein